MNTDDFDEMNYLSKKVLLGTASPEEVQEFKNLVDEWNHDFEHNLIYRSRVFLP
jgi:hypothetical protein